AMAYDPDAREIVLFGGSGPGGQSGYHDDTWSFNGTTWTQLAPEVAPSARASEMAYDPGGHVTILFGGLDGAHYLSDTWVWNGSTWAQLAPAVSPPGRVSNGITGVGRFVVIFGGYQGFGNV